MQHFRPFVIRVNMASSVAITHRLTLDAILAALIFERTRDLELAHETIPLRRESGVWAGSAAIIEGPAPIREVSVTQALKAEIDITPDMVAPGKRGYPSIEVAKGAYRNRLSKYRAYDTSSIWFAGFGDVEKVRLLMEHVPALGAKRNVGYGRVSRIDFSECRHADSGMTYVDGSPARPVPLELWKGRGGGAAQSSSEAWAPPYWSGGRTVCALPEHQVVDRRAVKRIVGMV